MIKTAVIFILSAFIIFWIGFLAGAICAASGAAGHFEDVVLKLRRAKGEKDADNGL